jgi:glutathione S-transferase
MMSESNTLQYELYYWPGLPGRGEFVRLAFEEAGCPYVEMGRLTAEQGGGVHAIQRIMRGTAGGLRPFAPPILKYGDFVVAQTANVLLWLAPRLGLIPNDETTRIVANQIQLSIMDLVAEVHDTHHPIATSLYYDDQKAEAQRKSDIFVSRRMPQMLGYFEDILHRNTQSEGKHFVGERLTYVDLSMFQVLEGLTYAFPHAYEHAKPSIPRLSELRNHVASRPNIAAYLASPRRIPFNENGIFRHYPELDIQPAR